MSDVTAEDKDGVNDRPENGLEPKLAEANIAWRQILSALIAPTEKAEKALKDLGVTLKTIDKVLENEMNENEVEQEIQDKGLNAPRLCPSDIDAVIVGETFTILPSGKSMVCELTLSSGFTVRGESSCVSIKNFDEALGQKISRVKRGTRFGNLRVTGCNVSWHRKRALSKARDLNLLTTSRYNARHLT